MVRGATGLAYNATKGEQVFKQCMTCHRIGPDAKNTVGPQQNGLIGRTAGTVAGFAYSPLNKSAGEAGLTWTEDNIFAYLPDPNAFLKKFLTDKGKALGPVLRALLRTGVPPFRARVTCAAALAAVAGVLAADRLREAPPGVRRAARGSMSSRAA